MCYVTPTFKQYAQTFARDYVRPEDSTAAQAVYDKFVDAICTRGTLPEEAPAKAILDVLVRDCLPCWFTWEGVRDQVRTFLTEHEYVYEESIFEELVHVVHDRVQRNPALVLDMFAPDGVLMDAMLLIQDRHPDDAHVFSTRAELEYERTRAAMRDRVMNLLLYFKRDLTTEDFESVVTLAIQLDESGEFVGSPVCEAFEQYEDAHPDRCVLLPVGKGDCYNED